MMPRTDARRPLTPDHMSCSRDTESSSTVGPRCSGPNHFVLQSISPVLITAGRRRPRPALFHVDLVEDAPILEVGLLRLLPAPEHVVDGDQLHVDELLGVLGADSGIARSVVVLGRDLLGLRR